MDNVYFFGSSVQLYKDNLWTYTEELKKIPDNLLETVLSLLLIGIFFSACCVSLIQKENPSGRTLSAI